VNLPLVEVATSKHNATINKIFKKSLICSSSIPLVKYKMSNFLMHIKVISLSNVIFDKTKYFWLERKDIKKFTISTLAKKLLQVSTNYEK
jgi:adenine-specific DNA glycosylase